MNHDWEKNKKMGERGQQKKAAEKEKGEGSSAPSGAAVIHLAQLCHENLPFLFKNTGALIRR